MHDNGGGVGGGMTGQDFADPDDFVLDSTEEGVNVVADFRQTMTELNKQYLNGLTDFAHSLGLGSNAQVGYNLPVDMLSDIPYVSASETESLGFDARDGAGIDGYLQFSGPANLAGKEVISLEAGSVFYKTYQQTVPEQLYYLNRAAVGGVNSFKLHGMPFSGYYPNTTWPGCTPFSYVASEMHGQRQPGWEDYGGWMNYSSRLQWAMQYGVAKVDVAFWLKNESVSSTPIGARYLSDDLVRLGYTYEYLSPDNFALEAAYVEDGVLAPTQQAFSALVVRKNETLTIFGVKKLVEFAKGCLPVVFYGGVPDKILGRTTTDDRVEIKAMLANMTALSNVHVTSEGDLALTLDSIGIAPRIVPDDKDEEEPIILLYYDTTGLPRDTSPTTKTLSFEVTGTPYVYDAWTGQQERLTNYAQTNHSTTITLSLAGNQTTMIAFRKKEGNAPHGVANTTASSRQQNANPLVLSNWSLTLESWSAPSNINNISGTVKRNTTYHTGNELHPWNQLDVPGNVTHVAGRGYYHSSFSWSPENGTRAVITMDPILHIAVLYVNGQQLPPLDPAAPKADISAYLCDGVNDVDIVVSSPLVNTLIPAADQLRSAGADLSVVKAALGTDLIVARENGLIGEVVAKSYSGRE
ncbi:uncharacterized protein CLAFUR5_06080 [Fulvia fulva]|uniref:Uncharacterized protein n=1 Tax=Passalora fulva TaxID=5499 RepID=A0A9Q8P9A9_PASFU|nr:uncharacterized protein CLAFUR5_06080 [Fulvia fulva]KAK4625209.1 hypothetical protein CLAFUR0_05943 [Fulvia fulva]UJO17968.1 hypothetical protein CLAFUR5_06080 [Fulvia fulva]